MLELIFWYQIHICESILLRLKIVSKNKLKHEMQIRPKRVQYIIETSIYTRTRSGIT